MVHSLLDLVQGIELKNSLTVTGKVSGAGVHAVTFRLKGPLISVSMIYH